MDIETIETEGGNIPTSDNMLTHDNELPTFESNFSMRSGETQEAGKIMQQKNSVLEIRKKPSGL
jgi:hypothetical protein